ncbi:MAG: 3-phosphoshikimate 1-carboxyvinyltransferase, partial [Victivallales bacterium]|nr:3-phosphoshikimate 1-carboxyvinyltransferase [Victivallales bacterium]
MKLLVRKSKANGSINVPGSKSHTIRALAIATMAEGHSEILNPLVSEDTLSALVAAEALGAKIARGDDTLWNIKGCGGNLKTSELSVDMRNSGTSLRVFAGIASLADSRVSFDGDASLRSRPMRPLLDALSDLGVETTDSNGHCPISVRGPIKGGSTSVNGASSQFLTSLLLSLPLARSGSSLKVLNLNEKPYVEMTLKWLADEGIQLQYPDDMSRFEIKGGQKYPAFKKRIPGDFSTAAFPLAAAAATGGVVDIQGLDFDDYQGDKRVFEFVSEMGAEIARNATSARVSSSAPLTGAAFDLNSTPDALPILSVLGALAQGETRLLDCPQARIKETDRIECMTRELRKMGANVEELPDGMVISSGPLIDEDVELESYGDHRIAMALAVAGMAT